MSETYSSFIKFLKKDLFWYLLICAVALVSTYILLNHGVIFFDDGFFPFSPYHMLLKELSLFNYPFFLGAPYNYIYNYLPFTMFSVFIINILHLPFWLDDFLYIAILQFLGSIGVYRIIKVLYPMGTRASAGAFFGSVFFMLNFNKVLTINEFYPVFISISLLPLLAYYILLTYNSSGINLKYLFYISILSLAMAAGYYESTFTFIIALGILSFIIYAIYAFHSPKKEKAMKSAIIIQILILTSAWVLPSLLFNTFAGFYNAPSSLSGASVLSFELNYNHGLALQSLITLDYPLAGFSIIPKMLGRNLIYYLLATILLFFSTQLFIFLPRKYSVKKIIKYFDLLIIIVFVLGIIDWPEQVLLYHFVFGVLFSISISWAFWIFQLWFSLVIGLSISAFLGMQYSPKDSLDKKKQRKYSIKYNINLRKSLSISGKWFPAILICILVVTYSMPIALYGQEGVQQNFGYVTSSYRPSQSLIDTGNFLSEHSGDGNVLELPITAGDYTINSTNSFWAVSTPLSTFTNSYIEYRDRSDAPNTFTFPILNNFQTSYSNNLSKYLSLFGIKYVVISKNEYTGNYPMSYNLTDYEKLISYFNEIPGYSFVSSFGNYTVFELNETNPLIYASNAYNQNYFVSDNSTTMLYDTFVNNTLIASNDSLFYGLNQNITDVSAHNVHVKWKQTSLNTYSVEVQANTSFALNFLEGYSPQWGSYQWALMINGKGVDKMHFVSNLFANGWILPKGNYSATIYLSYSGTQNILYVVSFLPILAVISLGGITYFRTNKKIFVKFDKVKK